MAYDLILKNQIVYSGQKASKPIENIRERIKMMLLILGSPTLLSGDY